MLCFRNALSKASWLVGICMLEASCVRMPATAPVYVKPQIMYELDTNQTGLVDLVAFDPSGVAFLATKNALYEVTNGIPLLIDKRPKDPLAMAPGGGFYGWLSQKGPYGQFDFQLVQTLPAYGITLIKHGTYGFDGLHLGQRGRLLVTSTPLEDWEGGRGAVEYNFWSKTGQFLAKLKLPERAIGIPDPIGSSILFLGQSKIVAVDASGNELWTLKGEYRKGAISEGANVALLNLRSSQKVQEAHLISSGKKRIFRMSAPIHHLALAPGGMMGAIAIDKGRLFIFSNNSFLLTEVPLSGPGVSFVTDVKFIDSARMAIGIIRSKDGIRDKRGHFQFSSASILVASVHGDILFHHDFDLGIPATYAPQIDVTYGLKFFGARTPHRIFLVNAN